MQHLLLLLTTLASLSLAAPQETSARLIELGEDQRLWMSQEDVSGLIRRGVNFMDVTDFAEHIPRRAHNHRFPDAPTHQEYVKPLLARLSS